MQFMSWALNLSQKMTHKNIQGIFEYISVLSSSIPKHRVSVPLQSPDDRHSLTADPTSMKPASQVKMAVAPNVV